MTYGLLERMPYDWSYCSGNTRATSVYRVYPGWGSRRVTRCLADPEAVADTTVQSKQYYSLELYISPAVPSTLESNWNLNKTLDPQNSAKLEIYKKQKTGAKS
jgi:hypothetical protein